MKLRFFVLIYKNMKIWKLNIELIHLLTINVFHMFLKYDKESASLAVLNDWEDQDCLEPIFRCKKFFANSYSH